MKWQILFSRKNKKKYFKMLSAEILTHHAKYLNQLRRYQIETFLCSPKNKNLTQSFILVIISIVRIDRKEMPYLFSGKKKEIDIHHCLQSSKNFWMRGKHGEYVVQLWQYLE